MNRLTRVALMLLMGAGTATAQTLEIPALGSLELVFQQAAAVESYPGQPAAAEVTFRNGEAFNIPSPGRVMQIEYLVEPGTSLEADTPFAVLRGPEMHHLEMSYESSQALALAAQRRFKSNKALYESKAINEQRWLEISEQYYALMLEYEHMRHFFELVVSGDDDPDALTLAAPFAGLIVYRATDKGIEEGDTIAQFLPPDAVRLKVALPNAIGMEVATVNAGRCNLAIERVSAMTDGFFVQAWTQAVTDNCHLMLGQSVLATPMIRSSDTYRVTRSAVFQLGTENYVLTRSGDTLSAIEVTLLATSGDDYLLQSATQLDAVPVLTSSVSAAQGILLGLGGE